jgi:soluble lytic murein transglycosylase-like protein
MNLEWMHASRVWDVAAGALRGALVAVGLIVVTFFAVEGARLVGGRGSDPTVAALDDALAAPPAQSAEAAPVDRRAQALANYLARRYRVAPEPLEELVDAAFAAGRLTQLDPLLILAVIAVESRFNPIAESDYGARGLMQVVPRFHLEKLAAHGGAATVLQPHTNIFVGARILDEYIERAGNLEAGLQLYNGAPDDPIRAYAHRVLAEYHRLIQVVRSVQLRPDTAALGNTRS